MTTIEERLEYAAKTGAHIAQMLTAPDTQLRQLGAQLAMDLAAWRATNDDGPAFEAGRALLRDAAERRAERLRKRMEKLGPELWAEWHRRALQGDNVDDVVEAEWLQAFAAKLPCGECRDHFTRLVKKYFSKSAPTPGFTDYFTKTVAIHNDVNERLGKPLMTVKQARERWGELRFRDDRCQEAEQVPTA